MSGVALGTSTPARPYLPWSARLLEGMGVAPAWGGAAIALGVLSLYAATTAALGALGFAGSWRPEGSWIPEAISAAMIGFCPAAIAYGVRGTRRDLRELRPLLRCTPAELARIEQEVVSCNRAGLLGIGLSTAAFGALQVQLDPSVWPQSGRPPLADPHTVWWMGRNAVASWYIGRTLFHYAHLIRAFGRLGRTQVEVDLLDPESLTPFVRHGLRAVLVSVLFSCILSMLIVTGWAASMLPYGVALTVAVAGAALMVPVMGVHERIRAAKSAELRTVREAVVAERNWLLGSGASSKGESGRLTDLVAYERRIESVREWPFDASAWLRFGLYATLGAGSWVGGAVVEQLLGAALG